MLKNTITITIPKEAYGLQAAFEARKHYDPLKQPKEYKKEYMRIFNLCKKHLASKTR